MEKEAERDVNRNQRGSSQKGDDTSINDLEAEQDREEVKIESRE